MKTELKSKLAKVADEFTSDEFLQFRAGLSFQHKETNSMVILTVHLKGCTRGNVKTDIIEEGTKLMVTCEKPVQETVMTESDVIKKGVEMRKFRESLKIPDGVMVNEIKTNFNEETSILTITMPKRIKEAELVTQTSSENLPSAVDKILKQDKGEEFLADSESAYRKGQVEKHGAKDEVPERETEKPTAEPKSQDIEDMNQETKAGSNEIGDDKHECTNLKDDQVYEKANGIQEEDKRPKRSNICVPVIVGSTIVLSLVVFVIHFMRKKKQPGKRKE